MRGVTSLSGGAIVVLAVVGLNGLATELLLLVLCALVTLAAAVHQAANTRPVPHLEVLHIGTHSCDDANNLMPACHQKGRLSERIKLISTGEEH